VEKATDAMTLGRRLLTQDDSRDAGIALLRQAADRGSAQASFHLGTFLVEQGGDRAEGERLLAAFWKGER